MDMQGTTLNGVPIDPTGLEEVTKTSSRSSAIAVGAGEVAVTVATETAVEGVSTAIAETACTAVAEGVGSSIAEVVGETIGNIIGGLFDGL